MSNEANAPITTEEERLKIWNELAAEREGATAKEPPTTDANAEDNEPEQSQNTEATGQESPAGPPADAPSDKPADAPQPKAEEPAKPDQIRELLAKIEKLEGRQRNVEGHIGGLKDAQQRMLDMLSAAKTAAANMDGGPSQAQVKEAFKSPEKWESLKADFPEWAAATEELFDARLAAFKPQQPAIDPATIERIVAERIRGETEAVRQEIVDSALDAVLPNWKEEVKSQAFGKWLETQPAEVKALADSTKVGDAARMLRLYEAAKQSDQSQKLQQERQQRLAAAAATPRGVRVPPKKTPDQMTPEELWNYEAEQREKQRAQRGY